MKFLIRIPIISILLFSAGCSEFLQSFQGGQQPTPGGEEGNISNIVNSEHQFSVSASYLLSHELVNSPNGSIITSANYSIRANLNTSN